MQECWGGCGRVLADGKWGYYTGRITRLAEKLGSAEGVIKELGRMVSVGYARPEIESYIKAALARLQKEDVR